MVLFASFGMPALYDVISFGNALFNDFLIDPTGVRSDVGFEQKSGKDCQRRDSNLSDCGWRAGAGNDARYSDEVPGFKTKDYEVVVVPENSVASPIHVQLLENLVKHHSTFCYFLITDNITCARIYRSPGLRPQSSLLLSTTSTPFSAYLRKTFVRDKKIEETLQVVKRQTRFKFEDSFSDVAFEI